MKKKTCAITGRAGFTLVELAVTIGIFAILAGIAIPGFSRWFPNYHLKSAARDLFSNMQLARLTAIKQNTTSTVTIGADSYAISLPDRTISLSNYGGSVQFGKPSGESVAAAASVTFNSRGMTDGLLTNTYPVYLKNSKDTYYRIMVTGIGNINLKKWDGSSWK